MKPDELAKVLDAHKKWVSGCSGGVKADLRGANLYGADLYGANLRGANLREADLREANLYGADLRGADLREANLRGANLYGANLRGANLYGANLRGANLEPIAAARTLITPEGDIIGWKKARAGRIIKLLIPKEAKRHNATGRKCRAQFADVLEISDGYKEAQSEHDSTFVYRVGERVTPQNGWGEDRFQECAPGIHFFLTKVEAENY